MKKATSFFRFALMILTLAGCAAHHAVITTAQDGLSVDRLAADIATLASDEFEGRLPGTPGGKKAIAFLKQRYEELGLEPGNGDSYFQEVSLQETKVVPDAVLEIHNGGETLQLAYGEDHLAWTESMKEQVSLSASELVFVGFSIVAPEYDWDDYRDVDVQGKTVVYLLNDPGFVTGDTTLFKGKSATKYSSGRYKRKEAMRQGAAGVFAIIDSNLTSFSWEKLRAHMRAPQITLATEEGEVSRNMVYGFFNLDDGKTLLRLAGLEYDSLLVQAADPDFRAIGLDLRASLTLANRYRRYASRNVLAVLPGASRPDEVIVYTAHWDHMGRDTSLQGDQIFNGAVDNASGTAALLTLAELFTGLEKRPERSILFMAVTAEESGLLGSRYYTENPLYPLTKTAAVINVDILLPFGKTRDVIVIGLGKSQLDDYIKVAARRIGLSVQADMWPQEGAYYRSDHINFARKGVPSIFVLTGINSVANGKEWGLVQFDNYLKKTYHTPSDEYDDSWDLAGTVDVLRVLFDVGYTISNQRRFPNWHQEDEFKPVRDAAMKAAGNQRKDSQ